jgi:hypothetical protein
MMVQPKGAFISAFSLKYLKGTQAVLRLRIATIAFFSSSKARKLESTCNSVIQT